MGTILMTRLAYISQDNHCTHINWTGSANNVRGIDFYKKIGAEVVENKGDRFLFQAEYIRYWQIISTANSLTLPQEQLNKSLQLGLTKPADQGNIWCKI